MLVSRTMLGHHKETRSLHVRFGCQWCVYRILFFAPSLLRKGGIITTALAFALLQTLANQGTVGLAPKAGVPYNELVTIAIIVLAPRETRTPKRTTYRTSGLSDEIKFQPPHTKATRRSVLFPQKGEKRPHC